MFLPYVQGDSRDDVVKFLGERGWIAPVPYGGGFGAFPGTGTIPHAYVIGPDGKVVFDGKEGYEKVVEEQLARIKYRGLGKLEVAPGLEKAATMFSNGEYAKSKDEAAKVKEKKADDAAVVADAEYVIAKVDETATKLNARAEATKSARRYHETFRALEKLTKGFKGTEVGDKADADLKALKKDKDVKKEVAAWNALEAVLAANEKAKDKVAKRKNLIAFYEKFEGTAAADEAKTLADALQ